MVLIPRALTYSTLTLYLFTDIYFDIGQNGEFKEKYTADILNDLLLYDHGGSAYIILTLLIDFQYS